jgi:hypothetical protein
VNLLAAVRRAAVYLVATGCLWIAGKSVVQAVLGKQTITATVLVVAIFVAFSVGLFAMNGVTRRIVAALCLFAAVIIPLGYMNPFAAGDMKAAGMEPPPVMGILSWMGPLIGGLLVLAWLIDPPRAKPKLDGES